MIDSHCHLDFQQFDEDREALVKNALDAGVHTIINIGVDLETSQNSIDLADKHKAVFATVGVHPSDATKLDDSALVKLREMAAHPKVKAIGEIGLDFYRDRSPRPLQREVFHKQLELAIELQLPIVIHTRESFEESMKIVSEYQSRIRGGVFHCFPGTVEDAQRVIDLGFIVSVGGVITFGKNSMAEVAAAIPLEHLMIETDAPYLTPVPFRGKRNQPAYVRHVCDRIAQLRNISPDEVEQATDRTAQKFFDLVDRFEG